MTAETPAPSTVSLDTPPGKPPLSAEDIAQRDRARDDQTAALAARESNDTRRADLAALVMDHWEPEGDTATCLGVTVASDLVPDHIVACLERIERDYEMDLIALVEAGDLEPADVGALLQSELAHSDAEARADAAEAEVEDKEAARDAYADAIAELRANGRSTSDIIRALATSPATPASERPKLQAFLRILAISERFPDDAPIIQARIDQIDLSEGLPSPISFIQTSILSAPGEDSGVSEAAQTAIAAAFDLTPQQIVTGSDFEDAMAATKTDADGNVVPAYTEATPLQFGLGVEGYVSKDGQSSFMAARSTHSQPVVVDVTSLSPSSKALVGGYLGLWKAAEDAGETGFFLDLVRYDIRGQSAIDEIELRQAARILNAVFGGGTGFDGEIVRGDDKLGMIKWQAQLKSRKGAAVQGDHDRSSTRANLQGLGIIDAQGRIDLDVLAAFGDYSRENWFGVPDYEAVQAHLAERFPGKGLMADNV